MDERTKILVCLGSAISANCVECFRHYHREALKAGLEHAEIDAAVKLGAQVKKGAHITVMSAAEAATGSTGGDKSPSCCEPAKPGCCTDVK